MVAFLSKSTVAQSLRLPKACAGIHPPLCCLSCPLPQNLARMLSAMQLLHAKGKPTIFTSKSDAHWKLVRKGVAPAFNPKNIR